MSQKQITSFSVDWHDCGLCCPSDKVHEKTTIYLRKNLIKVEQFNGMNVLLNKEEYLTSRNDISEFFDFINKMDSKHNWKDDYRIMVCDGSQWEMRLRYSDRTVKLIVGNIEKPDKGRKIEKMINDMLFDKKCINKPILFGC